MDSLVTSAFDNPPLTCQLLSAFNNPPLLADVICEWSLIQCGVQHVKSMLNLNTLWTSYKICSINKNQYAFTWAWPLIIFTFFSIQIGFLWMIMFKACTVMGDGEDIQKINTYYYFYDTEYSFPCLLDPPIRILVPPFILNHPSHPECIFIYSMKSILFSYMYLAFRKRNSVFVHWLLLLVYCSYCYIDVYVQPG